MDIKNRLKQLRYEDLARIAAMIAGAVEPYGWEKADTNDAVFMFWYELSAMIVNEMDCRLATDYDGGEE